MGGVPIRLAAAACALALAAALVVLGAALSDGGGHPVAGTAVTVCGGIGAVLALTVLPAPVRRRGRRR
jgi:hypothetical protein